MIRTLLMGLALLSAPALLAPPAFAATPEELDRLKSEAGVATDRAKAIDKLRDDYVKNMEKEKDNKENNKSIHEYVTEELKHLRKMGIPTNPDDPDEKVGTPDEPPTEEERVKLEALRDLCVEIKRHKAGEQDKGFVKDVADYVAILTDKAERKTKRYEKQKEASK